MTCKELQALLVEHQAGELSFGVRASLRFHAAMCSCCRALVKTYGLTTELAADLREVEVPAQVSADIEALLAGLGPEPNGE